MAFKSRCLFFLLSLLCIYIAPLTAKECPFCKESVIRRDQVYENEHFRILIDYAPIVPGHLLIIPKRHMMKVHLFNKDEWQGLVDTIPLVVQVFKDLFQTDQYIILEKNGPLTGQTVPHVHFHLLPVPNKETAEKAKTAMFAKFYDTSPEKLSEEDAAALAHRLREKFQCIGTLK